jgi:hypothetical protein
MDKTLQMSPSIYKSDREKDKQKTLPTIFLQKEKIKRQENENELQKLIFSRIGQSVPNLHQILDVARNIHRHIRLPMFLSQMKKIKREDDENENDLHRLMYSRVGRSAE